MQTQLESPLTKFLADVVDTNTTKEAMRKRWEAGAYRGVKADYAAWAMKWSRG